MKILFFNILFLFFTFSAYTQNSTLKVHVTNIEKTNGILQIGIFDKAEDYPIIGKQYRVFRENVVFPIHTFIVNDIPNGDYAITMYLDENKDDVCNVNFFGFPKEGFGFSNNAIPIFSLPSFNKVKFTVNGDTEISIKMLNQ